MRKSLVLLPVVLLSGCAILDPGGSRCGWRFEVLKPPILMQPTVVASGAAPLGLVGTATTGIMEQHELVAPALIAPGSASIAPRRSILPEPAGGGEADCTLADACRRIAFLEAKLRDAERQSRKFAPMPQGK